MHEGVELGLPNELAKTAIPTGVIISKDYKIKHHLTDFAAIKATNQTESHRYKLHICKINIILGYGCYTILSVAQ